MPQAAIYARISLDRTDGEGVQRQLDDCHKLAAEHGHQNPAEYIDNDVSAYRAYKRPAWDQLLADLQAGRITAVYAYHPDRLYRRLLDLEAFIDAVQHAAADVHTVKAGDVDLSTASGRMIARILGSVGRHESERIGERVSRAKQQRATQGRPAGGGIRPAGLTADRSALMPVEAAYLRQAAASIIAGQSWPTVVDTLNGQGHTTPTGKHWTVGQLRRTLTSPHVAGLRAYKGQIVGPATSPPIIDEDTWHTLRAGRDQRRRGRRPVDRYLLTGLIHCGRCGGPLYGTQSRHGWTYRCDPHQTGSGRGCGGVSIVGDPADNHAITVVTDWLADPAIADAINTHLRADAPEPTSAQAELDNVEGRLSHLAQLHADGALTDFEYGGARRALAERRDELAAAVARPSVHAAASIEKIRHAWAAAIEAEDRPAQRSIVGLMVKPIVVAPVGKGAQVPIAERLNLTPRWA